MARCLGLGDLIRQLVNWLMLVIAVNAILVAFVSPVGTFSCSARTECAPLERADSVDIQSAKGARASEARHSTKNGL